MSFLSILCKVLGYIWIVIAVIVIVLGMAGVWIKQGFSGIQEILSPFNFANWLLTLITIAPGIGLLILSNKLRDIAKIANKSDSRR